MFTSWTFFITAGCIAKQIERQIKILFGQNYDHLYPGNTANLNGLILIWIDVVYFDQQMHACLWVCMVEKDKNASK